MDPNDTQVIGTPQHDVEPPPTEETIEAAEEAEPVAVAAAPMVQFEAFDIPIGNIEVEILGFVNPRRAGLGDVTQLKDDIKEKGLLVPLIVHEERVDDHYAYLLIDGHRRLEAIKTIRREQAAINNGDPAGWFDTIRCNVHQGPLSEVAEYVLSISLHHNTLCFADRCEGVGRLYAQVGDQQEVARKLHVSQPTVSNLVSVFRNCIPEVMAALRATEPDQRITQAFAVKLSKMRTSEGDGYPDVERQRQMLADKLSGQENGGGGGTRTRTIRNKEEIELAITAISTEEDIDAERKHALLDFGLWYRRRIGLDELIAGTAEVAVDPAAQAAVEAAETVVEEPAEEPAATEPVEA